MATFADHIVSWDVTGNRGESLEPVVANIRRVPEPILNQIVEAIATWSPKPPEAVLGNSPCRRPGRHPDAGMGPAACGVRAVHHTARRIVHARPPHGPPTPPRRGATDAMPQVREGAQVTQARGGRPQCAAQRPANSLPGTARPGGSPGVSGRPHFPDDPLVRAAHAAALREVEDEIAREPIKDLAKAVDGAGRALTKRGA